MTITLHRKLGLNARIVRAQCMICGLEWEPNELVMLGRSNYRDQCPECKGWIIGGLRARDKCPHCGNRREPYERWHREELDEGMSIRTTRTCPDCMSMVEAGYVLIEVEDGQEGSDNPRRTGKLFCVRPEAIEQMIPDMAGSRVMYIPESAAKGLGLHDIEPEHETVEGMSEAQADSGLALEKGGATDDATNESG